MARQTRQQRRQRRTQGQPALAGGPPPASPPQRPTAGGSEEPSRRPARAVEERRSGFGPVTFVQEAIGELKKVEWPDQPAVISGTSVVIIACIIVGAYLYLNDQVWQYVVQHVLLR
jgi:preprotein translocase SecE subunit